MGFLGVALFLKKKNYLHDIEILKKIGEYKNIKQNLKSFLEELDLKRGMVDILCHTWVVY